MVYVLSRTTNSATGKTPFKLWIGYKSDKTNLCRFGSLAYVYTPVKLGSALAFRPDVAVEGDEDVEMEDAVSDNSDDHRHIIYALAFSAAQSTTKVP